MAYRYYHGESFLRPKKRNWTEGSGREKCVRKTLFLIRLQTRNNSVLLIHEPSSIPSGKVRRTSEQTSLSVCEDKRGHGTLQEDTISGPASKRPRESQGVIYFLPRATNAHPCVHGLSSDISTSVRGFFFSRSFWNEDLKSQQKHWEVWDRKGGGSLLWFSAVELHSDRH